MGREISTEVLADLRALEGSRSRRQLAAELCERAQWRTGLGRPALMTARKALAKLSRMGQLAPARRGPPPRGTRKRTDSVASPAKAVEQIDFGQLTTRVVEGGGSESRRWWELMNAHHYIGGSSLCGAQIRYLVEGPEGPVALASFSAAALKLADRDEWIGWSSEARRHNLHKVINNSRFLVLPWIRVPNLASHVLGLLLRRLPGDWEQRYGYKPVLAESFVQTDRFRGTSYAAANWKMIGETCGRGRQDSENRAELPRKSLWVFELAPDCREQLRRMPETPWLEPVPVKAPRAKVPQDWAEEELGNAKLGDERLTKRACELLRCFYARPEAQIPEACGSVAATKAAYRFFDNPSVTLTDLLQSHYAASAKRMAKEPVVLAVQDTTSLNYNAHPATENLGPIASRTNETLGMLVHSTLCFNESGTPLGFVNVESWTRDREPPNEKEELPFEQRESARWLRSLQALEKIQPECPDTQLVSVGDREADIYELFAWAVAKPGRPALLVRAEHDRLRADGLKGIWSHVLAEKVVAEQDIKVPRRDAKPSRKARISIRFAPITLQPPLAKPELGKVHLWAVLALEENPPANTSPVEWMILSTLPVETTETALVRLGWYAKRWGIEVFHRVLKTGCQIETRQLGSADRIEGCLAIDMIVAWRIFHLTKLGRETPNLPCTVYFKEHEWKALLTFIHQTPQIQTTPPSLREMIRHIASLGGFLGRKGDGEPGTQTIWLGLQRLDDIASFAYILAVSTQSCG